MSFVSDMAKFNMKDAQRQQLLGGALLGWQPGKVGYARLLGRLIFTRKASNVKASNLAARGIARHWPTPSQEGQR
jgi:hypothetical protein